MPTKANGWPFGGDEMGALVRARDWSATPLGPIEHWPAQLRTALDICLSSAQAGAVVWGNDLIQIYNDPFREQIGDKHPAAFGSPARLAWEEIWDEIGPLVDRVMTFGTATAVKDRPLRFGRFGCADVGYFSLSFNPIHADDGTTLGIFLIASETTDIVLADRALRESEAHYRHTVELNPQITWTAQPDGSIDYISDRWQEWTGAEGTGDAYRLSIHPDDLGQASEAYGRALETGEPFDTEHRIRLKGGEWRWVRSRAYPRRDSDGRVVKWYGTTEDIHDRFVAQERLRRSEQFHRYAVEAGRIGTWDLDWESGECLLSAQMAELMGFGPEEIRVPSHRWQEAVLPEDRANLMSAVDAAAERDAQLDVEFRIVLPDGRHRWLHSLGSAMPDPAGGGVHLLGASLDVTERKAGQEQVRANGEFLRQALEIGRMIAYDWDLETWTSTRSGSTAGAFAHLTGRAQDFFNILHRDDEPRLRAQSEAAARGDQEFYEAEYRIIGSNGKLYWISSQSRLMRDGTGRPARLAGIAQDITERKLWEQSLADSEERLRLATEVGGLAAWDWNIVDDRFAFSDQLYDMLGYSVGEVAPSYRAWAERLHPDDREETEATFHRAMHSGEAYVRDYRIIRPDGSVHCLKARGRFYFDAAGKPIRMIGVMQDVTAEREAEARQRLLLGELQHRVRNTLAIVRSIARRTAATTETVDDYTAHFDGRLNAFARTQAAVTRDPAAGVDLEALIVEELMAHGAREGLQVRIGGPSVRLQPKAAETLGLAIHELTTNSVKYGALITPSGRIDVHWKVQEEGDTRWLTLEWSEDSAARPISRPRRRGFGTELLERTLAYDLGAKTELRFEPSGLKCVMTLPLNERTSIQ